MKPHRGVDEPGFISARRVFLLATMLGLSGRAAYLRAQSDKRFKRIGMVGVERDEDVNQDRLWLEFNRQLRRAWLGRRGESYCRASCISPSPAIGSS